MRINYPNPWEINPSLIEIGDDIEVHLPAKQGIKSTNRGVVASRKDVGSTRYYLTAENGTIFAADSKLPKRVKVFIYGRETVPQETLFDAMDAVRERMK